MSHEHGTTGRYQAGCRCAACKDASYRYMTVYWADVARNGPRLKDAAPTVEQLNYWHNLGWSYSAMSAACGIKYEHLQHIATGGAAKLQRKTVAAIAGMDLTGVTGGCQVPAYGVIRRLKALKALGWTWPQIGEASGLNGKTLRSFVAKGGAYTTADTMQAIRAAYAQLGSTRPDGTYADKARTYAARNGYAPPAAWDDIDDPDEEPQGIRGPERSNVNGEDLIEAVELGANLSNLTGRFGLGPRTIYAALYRAGRSDLWDKIRTPKQGGVQRAA